jgi:urease beta subunit
VSHHRKEPNHNIQFNRRNPIGRTVVLLNIDGTTLRFNGGQIGAATLPPVARQTHTGKKNAMSGGSSKAVIAN